MDNLNNPYMPSAFPNAAPSYQGIRPLTTPTKIICILFIVFGALGVLGLLMTLVFVPILFAMQSTDFGNADTNNMVRQMAAGMTWPVLVVGAIGGVASILMLLSGISGLKQKIWGGTMIRNIAAFYLFFKIVEAGVTMYNQYMLKDNMIAQFREQAKGNPNIDPESLASAMLAGQMIGAGCVAVVIMLFYLWVLIHMSKAETRQQFA